MAPLVRESGLDQVRNAINLRAFQAIHVAENAAEADHDMSRVLREEFSRLYSVQLIIRTGVPKAATSVIVIGRSAALQSGMIEASELESVKWDGYIIRATPHQIVIAGYGPQGTIYGTYAFLKKVGLKVYPWHSNNSLKLYEPIVNAKLPAFSVRDKPFFELRDVLGHHDGGRFGATIRAYTLGDLEWARQQPELSELMDGGYIGWDHTAGYLVPIKQYRATHPEFYPVQQGVTLPPSTPTLRVSVCACVPKLADITIQNALAWMEQQPSRWLFGITDGDQIGWRCTACAISDPIPDYYTDRNLQWVNAVARAIRNKYPDNRVFTLAYLGTVKPPVETRLEPNALVLYAPWYWTSRTTSAVGFEHPLNVMAMEELMAWTRLFPGQIGVYDYPGKWVYGMAERLKFYAKHNIRWVYMNEPRGNLLHWVASQLLWDPSSHVDDLVAEFVTAFYGPAADSMLAYYALRRETIQQNSYTSLAFFRDQAFLQKARHLLGHAVQQAEDADIRTQVRIFEGVIDHFYEVLLNALAMNTEVEVLRRDFKLYLQWHKDLWEHCDKLACSKRYGAERLKVFSNSMKGLGLAEIDLTSTAKAEREKALDQAARYFDQVLLHRMQAETHSAAVTPPRRTFPFVQSDETHWWQTWASDNRQPVSMAKQSRVGLHGGSLSGIGTTLKLSQLPVATRGRLHVNAGHFRLKRRFEPAPDSRGYRYLSLHLHASHAVPITLYINEKPALRSDIDLAPGEQIIRVDLHHFAPRGHGVKDVAKMTSLTLDVWPQNLFYPYPDTHDTDLLLLGLTLETALPTPQSLPYAGKVIWMTHFRPNVPHAQSGVGNTSVGLQYLKPSRAERFRSFTAHRVLSPIAALITAPSGTPSSSQVTSNLQGHLKTAYGVALPVFRRSRAPARVPLGNAIFVGATAALAHDAIGLHDLDDMDSNGFVIRARNGVIAIAGHTWQGTGKGVATYLHHHGIRPPAPSTTQPSTTIKSSFLHELYLVDRF